MDSFEEGRIGERKIRELFISNKIHFLQADMIAKIGNEWNCIEIKYQEMFERPPFDGHGLPRWQVDARLEFQKETGIRARLYVVDKTTNIVYWQFMDVLIGGQSFQTSGNNPRIIFPLSSYNVLEQDEEIK